MAIKTFNFSQLDAAAAFAQRSEAVFAKTMRSRAVKFEENLIDNDNWRHGVK